MDDEIDYGMPSRNFQHPDILTSRRVGEHPFIQPAKVSLSPVGVAVSTDSAQNYDLYSTVGTWMASSLTSQFSDPTALRVFNNASPWRLGTAQNCMLDSSQATKVLPTEGNGYPFSINGDSYMDSPSSTDSFPNLSSGPEPYLQSFDQGDGFPNPAPDYDPSSTYFIDDESYHLAFAPGSTRQQLEYPLSVFDIMRAAPPSPALSISSRRSLELHNAVGPISAAPKPAPEGDDMEVCSAETDEEGNSDPPYSLLIYQALKSAPGMKLPLQGIYSWFEKNTAKGKDQNSKGWQNSIRHNLSMNAGFEAVKEELSTGKKAFNFWRLTEEAIRNGVQSTTRYRKQGNHKKSAKSEHPAPQRQRSGAKGGRAAKVAARIRRANQDEQRNERYRHQRNGPTRRHDKDGQSAAENLAHVLIPTTPMTVSFAEAFDLGSVIGCADLPLGTPIFYQDPEPGADHIAFDFEFPDLSEIHPMPDTWV